MGAQGAQFLIFSRNVWKFVFFSDFLTEFVHCLPSSAMSELIGDWANETRDTQKARIRTGLFSLDLCAKASLGSRTVIESVKLPRGVDRNVWISSRVLIVYDEVVKWVNLLSDICTDETCPYMTAGRQFTYTWSDDDGTPPIPLSAPLYMNRLVEWAHTVLSNGAIVPQQEGTEFPERFLPDIELLMKRFFRVYAHTYFCHYKIIKKYDAIAHLNMSFKHYIFFCREFDLVDEVHWTPLQPLIQYFDTVEMERRALK